MPIHNVPYQPRSNPFARAILGTGINGFVSGVKKPPVKRTIELSPEELKTAVEMLVPGWSPSLKMSLQNMIGALTLPPQRREIT
jgi:hypothetical protein